MMETTYNPGARTYTSNITPREIEILDLMAEGNRNKEIAAKLNISAETVKKHVKNIYQKTGAHNRIEALNRTKWLMTLFATTN